MESNQALFLTARFSAHQLPVKARMWRQIRGAFLGFHQRLKLFKRFIYDVADRTIAGFCHLASECKMIFAKGYGCFQTLQDLKLERTTQSKSRDTLMGYINLKNTQSGRNDYDLLNAICWGITYLQPTTCPR
tara:strand:+ start:62 stop:457 length:396 start_codon:yes stop_codon:yes gene_type:complete